MAKITIRKKKFVPTELDLKDIDLLEKFLLLVEEHTKLLRIKYTVASFRKARIKIDKLEAKMNNTIKRMEKDFTKLV